MEFSAFLVFSVWTSSMTYLTFGEGELEIIVYPYIHTSARVVLSFVTLNFYFADSQQLML